ncbi:tetratricopeptide repeat protein [Thalassotalea piscium]
MKKTKISTKLPAILGLIKCKLPFSLAKIVLLYITLMSTSAISAEQVLKVQLSLTDPQWNLALNNTVLSPLEVNIEPHEQGFAREIQPLMTANEYQQVADLFKTRKLANDSTALQLLRGQILLMLKDLHNAELAFKACLATMPDLAKAHQGLSLLYMQQQEYQKAQQHLIRSIELGRADAQVYAQLGFIHVQNDQPWSAIAAYRQALMLQPGQVQYQKGLLFALIESGDLTQARVLLKELINQTPNDPQLWLQRGQIALEQGNKQQALTNIEIALKLKPDDHSNQLLAAQLHLNQGSSERAVQLLKSALTDMSDKQEKSVLEVTLHTLNWLIVQQQWQLTEALIAQTNKVESKFTPQQKAQYSVYLAQLSIEKGQLDKAQKHLNRAISINPTLGDALLSLANLYHQKNQLTQAKLMYVRAQSLPDFQLSAWLGLAQIEIDSQHYKLALTYLKKAFKAYPARQDLIANIRALEKLVQRES